MNKIFCLTLAVAFAFGTMTACSSGEDKTETADTGTSTETTEEFDNSNFGLYKGVIAGSTGTIKIEIHNGNNVSEATISMDDGTDELVCTETFVEGEAIVEAEFTGENSSFTFSVEADGSDPTIENVIIVGHEEVIATIAKEQSENVAICYEGESIGGQDHEGVFNLVRNDNVFSGVTKAVDGFSCLLNGTINSDGTFSGTSQTTFNTLDVTVHYSGKFNGNNVSGSWSNSWMAGTTPGSNSGTFTGSKAL